MNTSNRSSLSLEQESAIALGQMDIVAGNPQVNFEKIVSLVLQTKE